MPESINKSQGHGHAYYMNILELSKKAQEFYESARTKSIISGFEKNVLARADYDNCLFVKADYVPVMGDCIFKCRTINSATVIDLYVNGLADFDLRKIAFAGLFLNSEWKEILNNMNGIIIDFNMDLEAQLIDGLQENTARKIVSLSRIEIYMLIFEIISFWRYHKNFDDFTEFYNGKKNIL